MNPISSTAQALPIANISLLYITLADSATASITKLTDSAIALMETVRNLSSGMQARQPSDSIASNPIEQLSLPVKLVDQNSKSAQAKTQIEEYGEMAKSLSGAVNSSADLVEAAGFHSSAGKIKQLSTGLTAVTDIVQSVDKAAKATSTVDMIGATASILTGVESLGRAVSVVNPALGLVVSLGAAAASAVAVYMKREEQNSVRPQTNFIDEGKKQGNTYLARVQQNNLQATQIATSAAQQTDAQFKSEKKLLVDGFIKKGGTILFDDRQAAINPAYTASVAEAMKISLQMKNPAIKGIQFYDEQERDAFKQNLDPLDVFPKSVLPQKRIDYVDHYGISQKKKTKFISAKQARDDATPNKWIGPTSPEQLQQKIVSDMSVGYANYDDKYVTAYVDKIRKQFGNQPWFERRAQTVLSQFQIAKKEIDKGRQVTNTNSGRYSHTGNEAHSGGYTGNTINFNKSLIEHFTINVKDGKEGIADFKRKVEEVLLEILNSASTIH